MIDHRTQAVVAVIAVVAVAALAAVAAACGDAGSDESAAGGPAATGDSTVTASPGPGGNPSEGASGGTVDDDTGGGTGDSTGGDDPTNDGDQSGGGSSGDDGVSSAALTWRTTGLDTADTLALPSGDAAPVNGAWLIVGLKIANPSGADATVSPADLKLQDWEDQLYPVSPEGLLAVRRPLVAGLVIPAGGSRTANVVFDVPQSATHGTEIVVTGASAGSAGEVRFPISR